MILYHMSQKLMPGDLSLPDGQNCRELCEPFVQALEYSKDCFCGMVLNAKYMYAVFNKFHLREWKIMQNGQQKKFLNILDRKNFRSALAG
mgnify:CR=1 FL=1